jgi:hypothetical protein
VQGVTLGGMKTIHLLAAGLLLSSAQAAPLAPDTIAEALRLDKRPSVLCDVLGKRFQKVGAYGQDYPFFLVKDSTFLSIDTVKKFNLPSTTFSGYTDQTWTQKTNDFAVLQISTDALTRPVRYITFYFDTRERFKTDICITSSELN